MIIKHNNPCGAALGADPREAYLKALECDPVSAFGSILAFNRPVDSAAAEATRTLFVEAIIAPALLAGSIGDLCQEEESPGDAARTATVRRVFPGLTTSS